MFDTARKMQSKSLLKALAASYRIEASPSRAARALKLAATVKQIKPGIYAVGDAIIDLWRMAENTPACSCKEQRESKRTHKKHLCPHLIALYLAGCYTPDDSEPTAYLTRLNITQPQIIAMYCRAPSLRQPTYPPAPQGWRVLDYSAGFYTLENVSTGTTATASAQQITRFTPFYE